MTARAGDCSPACGRPLRRDAERNRQRILLAAAEVFTDRGLEATLDDVARHAGVGVGTVYRRFPDKEALVEALFTSRIDALVTAARQARAAPDPWDAFVSYLEYTAATLAGDLGLRQLLMFAAYGRDRVAYARQQMRPVVSDLVVRAQDAGALRKDFSATDFPVLVFMLASVAEYAGAVQTDLWRRYLAMVVDALRPSREGTTPLPAGPLTPEDLEQSMRAHGGRPPTRGRLPVSQIHVRSPGARATNARATARAFLHVHLPHAHESVRYHVQRAPRHSANVRMTGHETNAYIVAHRPSPHPTALTCTILPNATTCGALVGVPRATRVALCARRRKESRRIRTIPEISRSDVTCTLNPSTITPIGAAGDTVIWRLSVSFHPGDFCQ